MLAVMHDCFPHYVDRLRAVRLFDIVSNYDALRPQYLFIDALAHMMKEVNSNHLQVILDPGSWKFFAVGATEPQL